MTDQNIVNNREQWFKDQVELRSSHPPINRKFARDSPNNSTLYHVNKMKPQTSRLNETKQFSISRTHPRPNHFPFNRQHKSKVIYRNLTQPINRPNLMSRETISHRDVDS